MISSKQYNKISKTYQYAEIDIKKYLKMPQIKNLISSFKNKTMLDIACGNGLFTKFAIQNGAEKVDCIDISKNQINLAKEVNSEYFDNIRFIVGDFIKYKFYNDYEYDTIFAFYALNQLSSLTEIRKACQKISDLLKFKGMVVGLVPNPENPVRDGMHYGISHKTKNSKTLKNGDIIIMSYYDDQNIKLGEIEYYYWNKKTYEDAFTRAGFKYKWIKPRVSKIFLEKFGKKYCETMVRKATFTFFTLCKI